MIFKEIRKMFNVQPVSQVLLVEWIRTWEIVV